MNAPSKRIDPKTLAGLLTAPVSVEQGLELKQCYDRLAGADPPPDAETAQVCNDICRTVAEAGPPRFAPREEMAQFRQWQLGGARRELLEAFRAEADAAKERAAGELRPVAA